MLSDSLPSFFFLAPAWCIIPGALVAYCALWMIYARYFHPLAKYPGPFWASVSRFWLVRQIFKARAHLTQRQLHHSEGPIIRIAPNEVAIADPEAIKAIYSIKSGFTKTDFYLPFRPAWSKYPDGFTCLDEGLHSSRRRIINQIFSMSNIVRAEPSIDLCMSLFMTRMQEFAVSGEVIDLAKWTQMYGFDVIGQLFFSQMFGFMKDRHDYGDYIKSLDTLLPILTAASVMPTYLRTPFFLGGAVVPGIFKALKSVKAIEIAAEHCVQQRQHLVSNGIAGEKNDILADLFDISTNKGEKVDFGLTEIKVEVYVALFAGSDTTAAAISSILYHLVKNPAAYHKLNAEIREAAERGELSHSSVQYREAQQLPYLDACCKEGMRVHPSVGLSLPRHVPKGGCQIAGEWFPEGTRVGVNAAVIHFNKEIFGHDAEEFNPDRWFREGAANMDRYMFQFGGGSRTCIGKNISLCEMYKLVPQLLLSFDLEDMGTEWATHNYWFNKPSKVLVRLRPKHR